MIYAKLFSKYTDLFHGFTTRSEDNPKVADFVLAQQVHGNKISQVKKSDLGQKKNGADGLISKIEKVKIAVRTADCLPILFYEPKRKIIAAVHAGWQGTLKEISKKMVRQIEKLKGRPEETLAVFGPHICASCYDISPERAKLFKRGVKKINGQFHLDLKELNLQQLTAAGLQKKNIEILPYCTACQNKLFYSFRKKDRDQMMFAVIGLR